MSIELKQAAQQALEALEFSETEPHRPQYEVEASAMRALRNAIQQAETQQPATSEPTPQDVVDAFEKARAGSDKPVGILRGVRAVMRLLPDLKPAPDPIAPATGEPVVSRNPFASRCYTMSESHLSGHRLIVGFEKLGDAQDAHEWVARQGRGDFTHPAPSVPDDVVRDAGRYRWLRKWKGQEHEPPFTVQHEFDGTIWGGDLDSAIDAAMLAAQAQKGQP